MMLRESKKRQRTQLSLKINTISLKLQHAENGELQCLITHYLLKANYY